MVDRDFEPSLVYPKALEGAIQHEPTLGGWAHICAFIEELADAGDDVERWLPALDMALEHWSPAVRLMPDEWLGGVLDGTHVQGASLARVIDAEGAGVTDVQILNLCKSAQLTRLQVLNLNANDMTDQSVTALSRSAALASLTHLSIANNALGFDGLDALLRASELPRRLLALDLSHNPGLLAEAHGRLARSRKLSRLRELSLEGLEIDDVGMRQLVYARVFSRLQQLSLASNRLTDAGVALIAKSPYLVNLRVLDLREQGGEGIGSDGHVALADSAGLSKLRELRLAGSAIEDRGLIALSKTRTLGRLEVLDVSNSGVTTAGIRAIAESSALPHLRLIDARDTASFKVDIDRPVEILASR